MRPARRSACARPASERWSPGARPGSIFPVVGVVPCRTSNTVVGLGGGTDVDRMLRCVAPDRLAALREEVVACRRCPRLVAWRETVPARAAFAGDDYWRRP